LGLHLFAAERSHSSLRQLNNIPKEEAMLNSNIRDASVISDWNKSWLQIPQDEFQFHFKYENGTMIEHP